MQRVLFISSREASNRDVEHVFAVPADGGFPTKLPIPQATRLSLSPMVQGQSYTSYFDSVGAVEELPRRITFVSRFSGWATTGREQVPQPAGCCTTPTRAGSTTPFISAPTGTASSTYSPTTPEIRRPGSSRASRTSRSSASPPAGVTLSSGAVHRLDRATGRSERLPIRVAADLPERREWLARGRGLARPSSARASRRTGRGQCSTSAARSSRCPPGRATRATRLTNTPGVHECSPCWSPRRQVGRVLLRRGRLRALHVRPAGGVDKARAYKLAGGRFYQDPVWSPDSKKIAYVDNAPALYWLDLATGSAREVGAADARTGPVPAPCGLVARLGVDRLRTVQPLGVSRGSPLLAGRGPGARGNRRPGDCTDPCFDASGDYLYFFASTNAGPVNAWFNLSRLDMRATRTPYLGACSGRTRRRRSARGTRRTPAKARRRRTAPGRADRLRGAVPTHPCPSRCRPGTTASHGPAPPAGASYLGAGRRRTRGSRRPPMRRWCATTSPGAARKRCTRE